ncbi:MFS transporter [Rhodococcus sp. UNC363MFTsu5.1]|uniref:MFS transporter n=1 Tax=Rhodococcus sp. UNC363MFTsu5.1 TaxID=1449069 RepID=UPI0004886872|nr:MFS transporter [Rhodococcus sp. UNC363MFTsu5.1]
MIRGKLRARLGFAFLLAGPVADSAIVVITAGLVMSAGGDAALLSLAFGARCVGILGAGIVAGTLADRLDKRAIILSTYAGRCALIAILPALAGGFHILPVMIALGVCSGLSQPAATTAVYLSVPRDDRANRLAVWHSLSLTVQVVAPAAAALLISATGPTVSALLLVAAVAIGATCACAVAPSPMRTDRPTGFVHDTREGFRYLRETHWLRTVILVSAAQTALPVPAWLLIVNAGSSERWFAGAQGYIMALFALGGIVATSLLGKRIPSRTAQSALLAQGAICVGLVALSLYPPFSVMAVVALLVGAAIRLGSVWADVLVATRVPEAMLGRVAGLGATLANVCMPVGYMIAGALLAPLGSAVTAGLAAAVSAAVTVVGVVLVSAPAQAPPALSRPEARGVHAGG